jgi:hypothetical protein
MSAREAAIMRRLLIVATVLLAGIVLGALGCGGDRESEVSLPSGWITIEGDSISLGLPSTFTGGDPADPAVAAADEQAHGETLASLPEGYGYPLLAWGETEPNGFTPVVLVTRVPLTSAMSIGEWTAPFLAHLDESTIEFPKPDRTYVVGRSTSVAPGLTVLFHYVFVAVGSDGYVVAYGCDAESAAVYDSVFTTSAETIEVHQR